MAWNTPRAWASLELVTAANMNTYISDLLAYLHGDAGAIAHNAGASWAGNIAAQAATFTGNLSANGTIAAGSTISTPGTVQAAGFARSGNTLWDIGNDGAGSGLDADLLDGLQSSNAATGNTIAARHPVGYLFASYFNAPADNQAAALPAYIPGSNGDWYHRWYNETNWQRNMRGGGIIRAAGTYDLGVAATYMHRLAYTHAWGGTLTVVANGSNGLIVGPSIVGSIAIPNGDALTFLATGDNYWDVV